MIWPSSIGCLDGNVLAQYADVFGRALIGSLLAAATACAPAVMRTGDRDVPVSELWVDPGGAARNLVDGPAGADLPRPAASDRYEITSRDTAGFSITYKARDARGRAWHIKIGPESQTEVVASRIVWALGYHQLPSFFVERWIGVQDGKGAQFGGARFRPDEIGLHAKGDWSWQANPFVGTRPYNGLLVLMMLINSTDLKNTNNALYEVEGRARESAPHWFVVKDLGASLGETGRIDPRRGVIDAFEREPFIAGVDHDGLVRFGYKGRHRELLQAIHVADVRWMCERVARLTDRQLRDAFRAGNFTDADTARYVARIRQKAEEGLTLQ